MRTNGEKLTNAEQRDWERYRSIVARNLKAFWRVIDSIEVIRKGRLYRAKYATFDDYVKSELSKTHQNISLLTTAAKTRGRLAEVGVKLCESTRPSVYNALSSVPDSSLADVVGCAHLLAGNGTMNAPITTRAKQEVLGIVPKSKPIRDRLAAFMRVAGREPSVQVFREVFRRLSNNE